MFLQQYYIGYFGDIDHTRKRVGRTFQKSKPPPLRSDDGQRTARRCEVMFGVSFDQGFDERSLPYSWWSDNSNDDGGRLLGQAVDERNMESLLFDLVLALG